MCFGASNGQYGEVRVKTAGVLQGLRFVHINGSVNCRPGTFSRSNWGCVQPGDPYAMGVMVTTSNDTMVIRTN